jgi:hypothetical protein
MSFVFYYPRQVLYNVLPWICGYNLGISVCDAEWTERELFSDFDMQRSFGSTMTQCEVPQESLADPSLDSKSPPPDASNAFAPTRVSAPLLVVATGLAYLLSTL